MASAKPESTTIYRPTVIVRDRHENSRKCSILPLKGKPDLRFLTFPLQEKLSLDGYVRLAAEGEPLSRRDGDCGIFLLDGSWRWVRVMERHFEDVPARSLQGFRSAYPRRSKLGTDPQNGLASVEALFVAHHLLGRPTEGLLDHYFWRDEFLRLNDFLPSKRD
jgi:pre-rRNA-processing protein TSR3